jgi:putative SOS response-associated peptidase YedK
MCGRYALYSAEEILARYTLEPTESLQLALEMPDNYNVSPGAHMPIIVRGTQEHVLEFMVWGLVPSWSKSSQTDLKLINARSENLLEKPMWKRLVKSHRCVVPARGFYEWKTENGKKQPYYITMKQNDVLSFAGLWDHWQDSEGVELLSFTIITTSPNKEMSAIHTRMPAILTKQAMDVWLSPEPLSDSMMHDVLRPLPDNSLNLQKVSLKVNYAGHNDKELIYPLPE